MEIDFGLLVAPEPGRTSPGPQKDSICYHDIGHFVPWELSSQAEPPGLSPCCFPGDVPKDVLVLWLSKVVTWPEYFWEQLLCGPEQLLAFTEPEGLNQSLLKARAHVPSSRAPVKGGTLWAQ